MSKTWEHHHPAAPQHERAAYHYKKAAKYDEAEEHEKAAHHAYLASPWRQVREVNIERRVRDLKQFNRDRREPMVWP